MMPEMTVNELAFRCGFEVLSLPEPEKEINGAYAGDLLSWVMGRGNPGNCWLTIMTNINVLAVASLIDFSCVILCEDSVVNDEFLNAAKEKGINVLRTTSPVYEACLTVGRTI